METGVDFLRSLQGDMSLNILTCLDDPFDLLRASFVSRFWRDFVISNGLCKRLCVKMFPQLARVSRVTEPSRGMQNSTDAGSSNSLEWEALERDHRVYASLLKALTLFTISDCIADAVSASSTGNFPQESIRHTLVPRGRIWQTDLYWSSKGQSEPTVPETLIYKLRSDLCVITEINIQPFQAFFQAGNPIYSAEAVRFRVGYPKSPLELDRYLTQLPLQQPADDKFVWFHTSEKFPMTQENHLQNFKLQEPLLCIGGFLQIELLGRIQRREMDALFYICVSRVQVLGRSLFPAFDVEIVDGNISLKYCPVAFKGSLRSSSDVKTKPSVSRLSRVAMWHLGGSDGFRLHHNGLGAELYELNDGDDELDELLIF